MLKQLVTTAVLVSFISLGGIAKSAEPGGTVTTVPPLSATPRQRAWLKATIQERVKLAEEIGEAGARNFASVKGWKSIFDGTGRTLAQGPDQVYRAADGIVHVIEAKGGTSPLITAYGFPQGSSEWAVESAKRVVNSSRAAATEKAAAQQVLKAAAEGRVQVHVVRTRYIVGEPTVSVLEQTATGTDEAALLARDLLEHVRAATPKAGTTPVREAADYVAQSADDVARTSAKNGGKLCRATKAAVVVGATVDVGFRVHHGMQVENSFRAGQISQQQREVAHAKNAAGIVGGWGGAFAGAKVGALGGGAVGTACGGVGAPIGAAAGGIAGGVAGYFVGEAAAEAAAGWTMEKVHAAGTTIADAATSTKRGITNASRYVWDD